jgi:hypothetical protein
LFKHLFCQQVVVFQGAFNECNGLAEDDPVSVQYAVHVIVNTQSLSATVHAIFVKIVTDIGANKVF